MASDVVLQAVRQGDLETIKLHISNGKLTTATRDPLGATCVHMAARNGNLELLKYLVESAKFPVNLPAENGALATHDAAALGHRGCLEYLLEKGCPLIACDCNGVNLLHLTSRFGNNELLTWLVDDQGMEIATRDVKGATALHYAAAEGNLQCLMYLIQKTPHLVNDRAANGTTATYLAAQNGHLGCLRYLVDTAGGDAALGALDGMQPVHAAAQTGQLECLQWLIQDKDILPETTDDDGATPLHFSAGRGHAQTMRWLLANDVQCTKDNLGGTPLHDAAEHGQFECARILVQHGCDANEEDDDGFTATELAKDCGHLKVAKYLYKEDLKAKKKAAGAKMVTAVTSDYSSPTNTTASFSSIVSDIDGSSSVFTDDEASSIINELSSTGRQHRVIDSPIFDPEPLYMRLFEKLTEDEGLADFKLNFSKRLSTTTDTSVSVSETSTLERDESLTVGKKKMPHYELVHPHMYSDETLAKIMSAHPTQTEAQKEGGDSKEISTKVELTSPNSSKSSMPPLMKFFPRRSDSPPTLTRIPSPSAITVVPEISPKVTQSSAYQSEGSARQMYLPLEPPTFTPPPPPTMPPPPLHIKTSPHHKRPLSHPFTPPQASLPPPPAPPLPPPPTALDPHLPPKSSGEDKSKNLLSPGQASPRPLTPSDLASIRLKPVIHKEDSAKGQQATNRCQKASPAHGGVGDYVNADFLAEIRAGGTLKKTKTKKSQLGKQGEFRASPTTPSSPLSYRHPSPSSSSTPSITSSSASSSCSSPSRSIPDVVKTTGVVTTPTGKDMPDWKKQFLARKAAEKTKREEEEKKVKEADEKKYSHMPPWKAELFRRKDILAKEYAQAEKAETKTSMDTPADGAEAEAKERTAAPPAITPKPAWSIRSPRLPSGGNMKPWELELLQARQSTP